MPCINLTASLQALTRFDGQPSLQHQAPLQGWAKLAQWGTSTPGGSPEPLASHSGPGHTPQWSLPLAGVLSKEPPPPSPRKTPGPNKYNTIVSMACLPQGEGVTTVYLPASTIGYMRETLLPTTCPFCSLALLIFLKCILQPEVLRLG